ncbi:MAG: apolipoprotein N-acyltransferase [Deltaproteobacteria bacterium]|nr:apolipoprotein N-acyltransferase [Deltaproteobacteria bacterium]
MKIPARAVPWAHGALFAVLYASGTPGYDVPLLPFVCWLPFFTLMKSARDSRNAAWRGFLAGIGTNLLLFYWIAYTVAVPGRIGWPAGCLAALLVAAYMGSYFSAAGFIVFRLGKRFGSAGLFAFPCAWTGLEYARSVLFTGSPWMLFGYSLTQSAVLMQAADLAGVFGLGFLLTLANVCLFRAGEILSAGERRRAAMHAAGAIAVLVFFLAYGSWRISEWSRRPDGPGLRIAIAQGGIDQSVKWETAYQNKTLEIYGRLTREAASKGARITVWPETAAPFFYWWEVEMSREVERSASENGVPLIFGAPWFNPSEGGKYYNSVFLLDRQGVLEGRYDKRHLVPFGEYIPLKQVFFFVRKMTEGGEDFSAGTGPALFNVEGGPAGASVCYEAVFPGIIRESVLAGARWLVNVTNDAWFGDTVAPRQHLAMARMRAVEFRRPMVRAANSGISALIDARGEAVATLGLFRSEVLVGEIFPGKGDTIYAKTGEIFAICCTIITFFILCILLRGVDGVRTAGRKVRRA